MRTKNLKHTLQARHVLSSKFALSSAITDCQRNRFPMTLSLKAARQRPPRQGHQKRVTTKVGEAKAGGHHQRQVTKFTIQAGDHQGRVSISRTGVTTKAEGSLPTSCGSPHQGGLTPPTRNPRWYKLKILTPNK